MEEVEEDGYEDAEESVALVVEVVPQLGGVSDRLTSVVVLVALHENNCMPNVYALAPSLLTVPRV